MIQFNTQVQTEIHPRHAMLHRKYRDLAIALAANRHHHRPAAATFIPSAGKGIAFDRPIAPVGSVLLCMLEPEHNTASHRIENNYTFRGYRGQYLDHTGETAWEQQDWFDFPLSPQTYATEHDERLMRSPRFLDTLIGLGCVVQQLSRQEPSEDWQLRLPPTLLGFELDEDDLIGHLSSQPNTWVQYYAQTNGLTHTQAWHTLDSATRIEGDIQMTGLRLIDARLCVDEQLGAEDLPPVLAAYHDLRPVLGRHCSNPANKLPSSELSELVEMVEVGHEPRQAAQRLRRATLRQIADGCSDGDLLTALRNPNSAMIASKIAKRQAWLAE